jgi:predicted metal-dependent hydrolase
LRAGHPRDILLARMDVRAAQELLARIQRDGALIAGRFGLRYRAIEAERPRVKRRYGICYADGTIRIRLRHAVTGQPLKYSSLVNTLCHELAHLRHFNHGLRFQSFYGQILEFARDRGIYQPGGELAPEPPPRRSASAGPPAPEQLTLFEGAA